MEKLIQVERGSAEDKHRLRFFIDGKELFYIEAAEIISHGSGHVFKLSLPAEHFEFLDGRDDMSYEQAMAREHGPDFNRER
jgi:hypothetical protein